MLIPACESDSATKALKGSDETVTSRSAPNCALTGNTRPGEQDNLIVQKIDGNRTPSAFGFSYLEENADKVHACR